MANSTSAVSNQTNMAIQNTNSEENNITTNPNILNDLGIDKDEIDHDFVTYNNKMENIKSEIYQKSKELGDELGTLNRTNDKNVYWEVFYKLELYNSILNKFFDKEYLSHPKIRIEKIKNFLEEITHKFTPYLVSISYKIENEEDIEAYEKEFLAKNLLTTFFTTEKKVETVKTPINLKELGANIIAGEKKSKLSDLLRKIESNEKLEKEISNIKDFSEYEKADLKSRIAIKYASVHKRAIELDNEEDGLIKTYVESLYNPETTTLDDKNLLLNLSIISKMQDFGIMKWYFDDTMVKVSNTEINLKHDWWSNILTEKIETNLKYIKIVEKDLNLAYYTSFFSSLLKNADKLSYGERNLKFKKILSDSDENITREELLLDTILKKTHEGSILFLTPDMEKWVQTENIAHDESSDKNQVKYNGTWEGRHVFIINVKMIKGLEGYAKEIIFVNKGNSFILNPNKPIVYFNVIENPFLEKPLIKWFTCADFDISMDKASRMRIDNNFLE